MELHEVQGFQCQERHTCKSAPPKAERVLWTKSLEIVK